MIKGKKIFITGGLGFFGVNIAKCLSKDNEIILYDWKDNENREKYKIDDDINIKVIRGDICDFENLESSMLRFRNGNPDIIIHLASITGIENYSGKRVNIIKGNILGSYYVLELAKRFNVERIIVVSTSEVYGKDNFRKREEDDCSVGGYKEDRWVYAISKLGLEQLSLGFYEDFGLNMIILRPFNVYGEGQINGGAVCNMIKLVKKDGKLYVRGTGQNLRSWCYIDDFINGFMLCLEKGKNGEIYNIGNDKETLTISMVAEEIKKCFVNGVTIERKKEDIGDVKVRVVNIDKIKEELGYFPKISIEKGLKRTVKWMI